MADSNEFYFDAKDRGKYFPEPTPGPWYVRGGFPTGLDNKPDSYDIASGTTLICSTDSGPDSAANAKLLAAAPDMYEALALLGENYLDNLPDGVADMVCLALAKARGEAE